MAINRAIRNFGISTSRYSKVIWLTEPNSFPQLINPRGLGIGNTTEYIQVQGNFIISETKKDQMKPQFDFLTPSYQDWLDYSKIFNQSNGLYLWYSVPLDGTEYVEGYARVKLRKFEKSEKKDYGMLTCPIEFDRQENWKTDVIRREIIHNEISAGKIYSYTYPVTYIDDTTSIVFDNTSNVELPLDVLIKGTCSNPMLKLIDVDTGETYAWLKIKDTLLEENDYFRINSDAADHFIVKYVDGQIVSAWGSIDRNGDAVLMIRTGKTRVEYQNEVQEHGDVEITMRLEYNAI